MSLADKFITQNDTELVMRDFQPSVSTSPAPLRTFSLPPLGFPPLPSQPDLNTNIAVTPQQLLTAALASLPLWFLLGSEMLLHSWRAAVIISVCCRWIVVSPHQSLCLNIA